MKNSRKAVNPMMASELAKMYGISVDTMRTILCRAEFSEYCLGRFLCREFGRVRSTAAYFYECSGAFDKEMKKAISRIKRR